MDHADITGLSQKEVETLPKNVVSYTQSKKTRDIILQNSLNFFNILLFIAAAMLMYIGAYRDAFFITFINITNSGIAIYQEIKAKKILDKLKQINRQVVRVIRNGKIHEVEYAEVVLGDFVLAKSGEQIVADGEVIKAELASLDESILTGESDYIQKANKDKVTSGTYVVTGELLYKTTAVGNKTYTAKLTEQATQYTKQSTLLQQQIDKMLLLFIYIMVTLTFLTLLSQIIQSRETNNQIEIETLITNLSTVVSALVPTGLVLVTTISYAVAAFRMFQYKVLVQKIQAVETMAQTTVLCMDKTGTLTTNQIEVEKIITENAPIPPEETLARIKSAVFGMREANKTIEAIKKYMEGQNYKLDVQKEKIIDQRPFNSTDKFSAVLFEDNEVIFLGAPEVFLTYKNDPVLRNKAHPFFERGLRCLAIMRYTKAGDKQTLQNKDVLSDVELIALIIMRDIIRSDVIETIKQLQRHKIELKILSGDNEESVAAIARMLAINKIKPISGMNLEEMSQEEFDAAALKYTIFGRVTPDQKQRIIESLQKHKRTTAMIGDGVNDVLAIKKADLGVAMNSGVQMAKDSADIVLLDNSFKPLPQVMQQGEQIYTNIVKVAKLFITKSVYSASLIILTGYLALDFPFLPRQTTLISLITVGIPAIFIALIPSTVKPRYNFSTSVLSFSIASGVTYTLASILTYVTLYLIPPAQGIMAITRNRTGVAVSLILGGLFTAALVVLDEDYSLRNIFNNLANLIIIVMTFVVFLLIINSEKMRYFFDVTTLTPYEWFSVILIFLVSTTIFFMQRRFRFI